jgi:hypothetical protein
MWENSRLTNGLDSNYLVLLNKLLVAHSIKSIMFKLRRKLSLFFHVEEKFIRL